MILEGYFYVGILLCSLHEFNLFGVRATCSMDPCHLFPQGMLAIIPLVGVTDAALGIEWGLLFALWLSLPYPGQGLLPNYWSRSPQLHF